MNERTEDLIVLAALGELTPEERVELDGLAAMDPAVAAELAAQMETAATLLESTAVEAPRSLRASVLDAVADTAQERPLASVAPPVASFAEAQERRSRRLAPLLSAAAAIVLVVAGSFVMLRDDGAVNEFDAVAEADDAQTRAFDGLLGGSLTAVHSASQNALILDGDRLPALAPDKAYVLWFISDAEVIPVGQFRPDDDGSVQLRLDDLDPADVTLGITEEPITGSDVPTEPILALA